MSVSFAIMAHPDRSWMVEELSRELDVHHEVRWDRGRDRWDTGARAWSCYGDGDWHVVLQDDAILCDDFVEKTEALLDASPYQPVSLYLGGGRPRQRHVMKFTNRAIEGEVIEMPWLIWGVAIALPTNIIQAMLFECKDGIPQYDTRMSHFFERRRIKTLYAWPSLVDHRDAPSLVHEGLRTKRVALNFEGSSREWGTVPA